jgi:AraC-like DNA-binding protein
MPRYAYSSWVLPCVGASITMPFMETVALVRSPSFSLQEVRCRATSPAPSDEEEEPAFSVAVPTAGVYVQHLPRQDLVGTVGVALLQNRGDVHRTTHPAACGDRIIELSLSDPAAEPFTRPRTNGFPRRVVRVPPVLDLEIRLFARRAKDQPPTSLELDDWAEALLERLLVPQRTDHLSARQRTIVDSALEYLGWHFAEDADLPTVAAAVGSSPHHLSRLFHRGVGSTLSRHRTELRLRAAIERIENGAADLSAVASDVGFFDHAHLTRTFRKALGTTPTQIRSALGNGSEPESRWRVDAPRSGCT